MSLEGRTIALVEDDPDHGRVSGGPPVPGRRAGPLVAELRSRSREP